MKKVLTLVLMVFLQIGVCFSGQLGQNEKGFYYVQDDGTLATSKWIDADFVGEGKSSSYYFDENGFMLMNTTTPDGYFVGADGKWDGNSFNNFSQNATMTVTTTISTKDDNKIDSFSVNGQHVIIDDEEDESDDGEAWLSATGNKYHSIPDCGNMNPDKARKVTIDYCKKKGIKRCTKCW